MTARRLLPYSAALYVEREAIELERGINNVHQDRVQRVVTAQHALERAWLNGEATHDGHAFRWGLVIGAATGGVLLGVVQLLGSML